MDKNKLTVRWSKTQNDFMIRYPNKRDGNLTNNVLFSKRYSHGFEPHWEDSFVEDLKKRGYDLTTLKFEVKRKPVKSK